MLFYCIVVVLKIISLVMVKLLAVCAFIRSILFNFVKFFVVSWNHCCD